MEKKRILLCGLKGCANLGDEAILQCTKKIIEDILIRKNRKNEFELKLIDFTFGTELGNKPPKHGPKYVAYSTATALFRKPLSKLKDVQIRIKSRKLIKQLLSSETCAIVFAGGGIIKYKYQKFYIYIDEFTREADRFNIPILFSGVGIEGYDVRNPNCRILLKSLSRKCIKIISTRDDFRLLNNYYLKGNPLCERYKVADPVCSINQFYPIPFAEEKNTIGFAISRFDIFKDNGITIAHHELPIIWKSLIEHLEKKGIPWKIFTTGLPCDYEAELELKQMLPQYPDSHFLPRPRTVIELLNIFSQFKATCVCRLHASIISYSLNIPSMALVWNKKQIMFAKATNQEKNFISYPDIYDTNKLTSVLDGISCNHGPISKSKEYTQTIYHPIERFFEKYINEGV